ncbi:MAG: Asp-tRNA(Asn)/Glu-tRNA(Gln) amidotransferase subunit GatC [Planctomycetota bacterium]|jgi:aspartyl-tRNA(Asn)/glutamyl-tRNA(Gln) amidotransferase subunit C
MPQVDEKLIRHIGRLSRIELTDEQVAVFGRQFADIVAYMDKLQELDTEGVEPMAHAVEVRNVFGEDDPAESLGPDKALSGAPDRHQDFYKVPKVIGDS